MKSPFEAFLKAEELDELLKLRGQIQILSAEEDRTVLAVIESWSDQQAVSNLLFHPSLIPAVSRERFVLKGLGDPNNTYFVLAAVVGTGALAKEKISSETRSVIKQSLIAFWADCDDVVGERASVSLRAFLEKTDLPVMIPLFSVRNDIVRENIVGWIVQTWGGLTPEKMTGEFKLFGLSWFQRRRVLGAIHKFTSKRSGVVGAFKTAPLLSYIPNLKEVRA